MGLSIASVRLSMAAAGLLTLVLFGVLAWELTRHRWVSLLSVWVLGTSPLFFIQSRIFLDPLLVAPFVVGWLICIVRFERNGHQRVLVWAAVFLGIGYYSYSVARMLMPVYLAMTLLLCGISRRCSMRTAASMAGLFTLLLVPALTFAIQNGGLYLDRFRSISWLTPECPPTTAIVNYLTHYVAHFDPTDLFLKGDSSLVHSTGRAGVFLISTLPLAAAGTAWLAYQTIRGRDKLSALILVLLLSFPIPNALLAELHRPVRAAHILPIYALICVVGMHAAATGLWRKRAGRVLLVGLAVLYMAEAARFFQDYYTTYPYRLVATGHFKGNKPLAFRTIMASGASEIYLEWEEPIFPTYVRFFQLMYGYEGSAHMVQSADASGIPAGALLLTRQPSRHMDSFERVVDIPELAANDWRYTIMRKRGPPST